MPKFRTKNNRLTAYSFACGYIEQKTTDPLSFRQDDLYTELSRDGCYHVKQFDHRSGVRVFWATFSTLEAARKRFDQAAGWLVQK